MRPIALFLVDPGHLPVGIGAARVARDDKSYASPFVLARLGPPEFVQKLTSFRDSVCLEIEPPQDQPRLPEAGIAASHGLQFSNRLSRPVQSLIAEAEIVVRRGVLRPGGRQLLE